MIVVAAFEAPAVVAGQRGTVDIVLAETLDRISRDQADVIRRIFRDFINPGAIAKTLNDEDVTGPERKLWNDTTIRGHVKRGTGIINNEGCDQGGF